MIGFCLGLQLCTSIVSSSQSKKPHSFSLLSCKLAKDASLSFITASYLQNTEACINSISKASPVQLGVVSLLCKANVQGTCDLVTLTWDFDPAFHTLLKIVSLRSSDFESETQSDVMSWNKLSMSALSFLLWHHLPRTMMIASYSSHCYMSLWACVPELKGQGS